MELVQHEASEFTARLQGRMVADNSELKMHKSRFLLFSFPFHLSWLIQLYRFKLRIPVAPQAIYPINSY